MKLHVALSVATLLLAGAGAAPSPATQKTQQSSKATLDFIAHEQSQGAGQAAPAAPVRGAVVTTPPPRISSSGDGDTQQHLQHNHHHHQQRVNASSMPKKDWELVPSTPRPSAQRPTLPSVQRPTLPSVQRPTLPSVQRPTLPSVQRPTPPTYAGVVKDHSHDHSSHGQQERTSTPRVYHIPISVEQGYTTSTEASRWYDKLFGKGLDSDDDSPWGRRRRQVAAGPGQPEQPRSEIVIGSNAIRVAGARPPARTQPAKQQ